MKPLSRAITTLGYIFAIWCLYTSTTGWLNYSSEIEARRAALDTAVAGQTDSILRAVLYKTIVPQVLFALLLLIPYWKLKRRQSIPLLCLLLLAGALIWRNTFGHYFLTERFIAELVPQQVWIASGCFFVFLIAFISVTAINTEICRPMHLTPMPSALLARHLRSRLWCQKQVGASDRGRSARK